MRNALFLLVPALLQAIPSRSFANATCNASDWIVCYETDTYPMFTYSFGVVSGHSYEIKTLDLKNLPGQSNVVDTLMWLLNTSDGTVVAINDDYSGYASRIYLTATSSYTARLVVANYGDGRQGTCDIEVRDNGQIVSSWNDVMFGGWNRTNHAVKSGDRLFVGVPPDGADHTYCINKVFVFSSSSTNCSTNCGRYVEGDGAVNLLSRAFVNFDASYARVLVGSNLLSTRGSTRLFHSRLGAGWGGARQYQDADGDGLTYEIEALKDPGGNASLTVDTCDYYNSEVDYGPSSDCRQNAGRRFVSRAYTGYPWSAKDTDNDGIEDGWELFGVAKACSQIPQPPFNSPGTCIDMTWTPTCQGPYCVSTGVSSLGSDPREYDAFYHLDYQSGYYPTSTTLAAVSFPYEEEGRECPEIATQDDSYCPGQIDNAGLYYRVTLHMLQGAALDVDNYRSGVGLWETYESFNATFTGHRKYTGIFNYGLIVKGACPCFADAASFISGNPYAMGAAISQAHEMAHSLGIGGDNYNVNYPSLSSYSNQGTLPAKAEPGVDDDLWPDDFGNTCSTSADCPISRRCSQSTSKCILSCNGVRFSRGVNPTLVENSLQEHSQTTKLTAEVYCGHGGAGWGANAYHPLCDDPPLTPGACGIDWDDDGTYTDSSTTGDLDGNPDVIATQYDYNDWTTMYNKGRIGLGRTYVDRFRTFASDFDSTTPTDVTPWDQTITVAAGVTQATGVYGSSLAFRGPGMGDSVVLSDSPSLDTMGTTVNGFPPKGFRVDAFVYVTDFLSGSGHQVVYSDLFQIDLGNTTRKFRGFITYGPSIFTSFTNPLTVSAAQWYWVSLQWNTSEARLYVIPWGGNEWNFAGGQCARTTIAKTGDVDPGAVTWGSYPTAPNFWALNGRIDQPAMWNWSLTRAYSSSLSLSGDVDRVTCP